MTQALRSADIGIAMGNDGHLSDMILVDDNFATIISPHIFDKC